MDFGSIYEMLTHGGPQQFAGNVVMLVAARWILMPVVNAQLEKIQVQLGNLSGVVSELQVTLNTIETNHNLRISALEGEIKTIKITAQENQHG